MAPQLSLRSHLELLIGDVEALFGAPLFGFIVGGFLSLGEKIYLLGDDLTAEAVGTTLIGPLV